MPSAVLIGFASVTFLASLAMGEPAGAVVSAVVGVAGLAPPYDG